MLVSLRFVFINLLPGGHCIKCAVHLIAISVFLSVEKNTFELAIVEIKHQSKTKVES